MPTVNDAVRRHAPISLPPAGSAGVKLASKRKVIRSHQYEGGKCDGRDRRRRKAARTVAPVLLAAVLAAGCASSPEELKALKAEPMASAAFDGLTLLRSHERDAKDSNDTITGKSVDAQITRVFEPDDPQRLPDVLNQVVDQAAGDGWEKTFASSTSYTGEKAVGDGTGQLQVTLSPCENQTCLYLYLTLH